MRYFNLPHRRQMNAQMSLRIFYEKTNVQTNKKQDIFNVAANQILNWNIVGGGGGGRGSNFFQVGSNCLFPVETHITCDFPGGGGRSGPPVPPPPLDPHLVHAEHMIPWLRAQWRFALKLIGVFTESFGLFIRQLNYYVSRWTTPMVVMDSSTLQCIFEILLLMTYEELSRTFGLWKVESRRAESSM